MLVSRERKNKNLIKIVDNDEQDTKFKTIRDALDNLPNNKKLQVIIVRPGRVIQHILLIFFIVRRK